MTLREQQYVFSRGVSSLLQEANRQGLEVTLGEAWRSPEEARRLGNPRSLHAQRLAIDLNLFREGVWLRKSEEHRPLGEWWEQQHPLFRWGGRFGDGNHYSMAWGGRA